jgi:hypothetical protein
MADREFETWEATVVAGCKEGGTEGGRGMGLGRLGVWDLGGDRDGCYSCGFKLVGFLVLAF